MCKIAIIPNIKEGKVEKAFKFSKALTPYLCDGIEKDGFGYMALGENGIFGERWMNTDASWDSQNGGLYKEELEILMEHDGALVDYAETYNKFGTPSDNVTAMCLHARYSTNNISMENTHPFLSEDKQTALIHNGVVDSKLLQLRTSTCDSEGILNAYTDLNLQDNFEEYYKMTTMLSGYYALGVFSKTQQGDYILDVVKSSASLDAIYIPELETIVYCTNIELVKSACNDLKWAYGGKLTLLDNKVIRYNAVTGELLNIDTVIPYEASSKTFKSRWNNNDILDYYDSSIDEYNWYDSNGKKVELSDEEKEELQEGYWERYAG